MDIRDIGRQDGVHSSASEFWPMAVCLFQTLATIYVGVALLSIKIHVDYLYK
jgi:hypothetical protein